MKLMKHITIALVLCAIPAMAVGQTVTTSCADCTHNVSVYMGEGGLVATADGAEKVTWVARCGGVTRSGQLDANDAGMVSALFTMDNGLACSSDDGSFELGPIMDGGWFWITDDMNSAVGGLVAKDVLMNDTTAITGAGAGVTMTKGKGAVYLKETASGRVGILPNILAVPHVDPPETDYCDYTGAGTTASPYARQTTSCMLGDGSASIVAMGPADPYTGDQAEIMNGATVTRPVASGASVVIDYALWGDGGHYNSSASATETAILLGHNVTGASPLSADWTASAVSGGPTSITDIATAGLSITSSQLTITPQATYCSSSNNHSVTVTVNADATTVGQVTPPVKENAAGNSAATHKITVVCPAAASSQGAELVPENPFPVE